ncbi:MAG TPA: nitroreductase family deazaflavin-dependent oxidoreductase [Candidatus Ruania gallistercoris]|uniref:Nitroreductase family deazaflavin-dependent oxidoreductase n=1 Tax=Candidatus Ruania gallistercoris TaxID=2838746 RepID=A0A9D2J619_9MICO|nr:nitroreductase family deazaflavin-dependent oxidoreductase [Candidatus Ruania gallistercoris]
MSKAVAGGRAVHDNSRSRSQRMFNCVVRRLLTSPVHGLMSGKLIVIEVTGRRTGTRYSVPTAYAERGEQVLVGSAGTWVRNLSPERPVVLVHRGRRRSMVPEVVTDAGQVVQLVADLLPGNSILQRNMGVTLGADGSPDRAQLAAARARGWVYATFAPA